jgi:hypothetical protein
MRSTETCMFSCLRNHEADHYSPGLDIDGAQCGRKSPTWFVRASLPLENGPDGKPNASYGPLVKYLRALSLITVPIASGMVGIVLILFLAAWSGGAKKWARTLNIVSPALITSDVRLMR